MLSSSTNAETMIDFFISYVQADRAWAEWIAWILEAAGFTTKNQAWDFGAGANFILEMHKAASEAERTIAVLSPEYLASDFARMEWAAALAQKRALLPIRIREVEPVGLLAGIVYTDLVGLNREAAQCSLLAAAKKERPKPLTEPPFAGEALPFPIGITDLPEAKLPEIGPLPRGSRLPFARNPLFVGREEDLRTLARQLRAGETSAIGEMKLAATSGLGGIGKTQLASEFAHRYGRYFQGGVCWMSFADPAAVPAEVAACGRNLDLHPAYDTLPLDQQVRLVEEIWTQPTPRLLVFDNCEEEDLLDRWRPRFGGARVLITSRRPRWDLSLGVQLLQIATLPRAISVELLRKFRSDIPMEEPAVPGIAAELGDLPLALHLAGSFLERYAETSDGQPANYLAALRRDGLLRHPSLQGKLAGLSPTSHEAHVGRTFALSVEKLKLENETDALAAALLARAAYFAPGEPIPRDLLLKTVGVDEGEPEARLRAEDSLGRLKALGLLEAGKAGTLVVHRLVSEFARSLEEGKEVQAVVEDGLFAEAARLNEAGYPAPLMAWQSHLRAVVERAQEREDERAAQLCGALDYHLGMIGDYLGARPYSERALAISEKVLGTEHPDTARYLNNLGLLLQEQGDFAGARPHHERALAIRQKSLGTEHPDTAIVLNNLGLLLWRQGDFTGAGPYYAQALEVWEKALGAEHPYTAQSLNNLGVLLTNQGDLVGARPYFERALMIREKVLGPEHPNTAQSLNNLGALLKDQGDLIGARPHYERALAISEKVLGTEHPNTASYLNSLGLLLQEQGDFAGARPHYERALAIRQKALGTEHPDTANVLNNLGLLLWHQGDFTGALPYYAQALETWEKALGTEHPLTATGLSNLGLLLQDLGDFAESRRCSERALAIRQKVLGAEHPDTADSLNNLGALLESQGDLAGARPYLEQALAIWEKVLGAQHPNAARGLNNLGALLKSQGDIDGARSYYERALAIREKVLDADHPDTATSLNSLGVLLVNNGDLDGARPYLERALAIREKVLGLEHSDTALSLSNFGTLLRNQGDLAGARPCYEQALAIFEAHLGPDHPHTRSVQESLASLDAVPDGEVPS